MKDLIVSYLLSVFYINGYFEIYISTPDESTEEFIYYSIKNITKQLGENDVVYLVEVEYYNSNYQQVNKTITISNEELLVYLFSKI